MSEASERTAVYRIRGEDDVLLYIGMTNSVQFRWNQHQAVQPWWDEVRSITVEWYDTRAEAAEAEEDAIVAEQPKYNVTYLKPGHGRRGRRPNPAAVDWKSFIIEPQDDDEDLLNIEDVRRMVRMVSASCAKTALRNTGGPRGFKLGSVHLYRTGHIRQWIAAAEASQCGDGPSADESDESEADAA